MQSITTLQNTKNAIKQALINKGVDVSDNDSFASYAEKILSISGSSSLLDKYVTRTEDFSIESNDITKVGKYAFYGFDELSGGTGGSLISVSFPNATIVEQYAFNTCLSLTSANLPNLVTIEDFGFSDTGLTSMSCNNLTTIGPNAFSNCDDLVTINFPSVTKIYPNAFYSCRKLISATFPGITEIECTMYATDGMYYAFNTCTALETISFPNLVRIGSPTGVNGDSAHFSSAFYACFKLKSITFPKLEKIYCTSGNNGQGTFFNNSSIEKLYFPKLDTITTASENLLTACQNLFKNCSSLTELHFGAANQAAIEASPGYSTAWGMGAGNVTIYFDL